MLTAVTRFLSLVSATNHNLLPVWVLELPLGDGEALQLHLGDDLGGVQGRPQHLLDLSREQPGLGVCGEMKVEVDILQESIGSSETHSVWNLQNIRGYVGYVSKRKTSVPLYMFLRGLLSRS